MNLNLIVKEFFEENKYDQLAERILLVRQDGIHIYSNLKDQLEASSMGALIGGVWQAAQALSEMSGKENDFAEHRLGFDTSAGGVYILPLKIMDTSYYLGAMYWGQNNPAKLKRNLRFLNENLELYLSEVCKTDDTNNTKADESFLFDNISDDEMDNLFSFGGA